MQTQVFVAGLAKPVPLLMVLQPTHKPFLLINELGSGQRQIRRFLLKINVLLHTQESKSLLVVLAVLTCPVLFFPLRLAHKKQVPLEVTIEPAAQRQAVELMA